MCSDTTEIVKNATGIGDKLSALVLGHFEPKQI